MDTTYLGVNLRNPLVASAGPLTQTVDDVRRLADTGVGAVVLHSMFAEKLLREANLDAKLEDAYTDFTAEATSFFPETVDEADPAKGYLTLVEKSAAAIDIPLIASLNAAELGDWVSYAQRLTDAGASAIECNVYLVPGDVSVRGADVEARHLEIVQAMASAVDVPISVKMSPFFSSVGNFALQLVDAGASGLVLFNRFLQPQVDVKSQTVQPGVELSTSADGLIARTWIASLRNHTTASLAASSGVHVVDDLVAHLLAGADVAMVTSALVRNGVGYAGELIDGLARWTSGAGYASVADFRGKLSVPSASDGAQYARSGYLAALENAKASYAPLRG